MSQPVTARNVLVTRRVLIRGHRVSRPPTLQTSMSVMAEIQQNIGEEYLSEYT